MDCAKIGALICRLRKERNMTQKQLADAMHLSDRTISKWERGMGCPDVSLLTPLSEILNVNLGALLQGDMQGNDFVGGNMKQAKYYVCPSCANLVVATGEPSLSCCGRGLDALVPRKAEEAEKLCVEDVENEWYITSDHPMTKENYISFVVYATGDKLQIYKQYPEWDLQTRIFKREHGKLIWYSTDKGLLYQLI